MKGGKNRLLFWSLEEISNEKIPKKKEKRNGLQRHQSLDEKMTCRRSVVVSNPRIQSSKKQIHTST